MAGSDINRVNQIANNATIVGKLCKPSVVELKNGRVLFKQKCTSFEKLSETMQGIVKFREMLERRIESQAPPLTVFPDEHKPLIAKLAHESDKTLSALTKHIHHELLPAQDEDEEANASAAAINALSLPVVEAAIKSVVSRNNYGLDGTSGGKVPAAVCIWRWEVKEEYRDWLPKNAREKAEIRQAERSQAKKELALLFESLTQEERDAILDPKGVGKLPPKETNQSSATTIDLTDTEVKIPSQISKETQKTNLEDLENEDQSEAAKTGRPRKAADPEKAAKEKERQEKKAARAEKEKKEKEAQNKSRSLMANFFGKAKGGIPRASPSKESELSVAGPSTSQSEFERTFKPFVLKKDLDLAPINWFHDAKERKEKRVGGLESDVIIIDVDERHDKREDVTMKDIQAMNVKISDMGINDRLSSILSSLPPSASSSHTSRRSQKCALRHFKTYNQLAVRDIILQLSEAEIAGDTSLVRSLLSLLCDRTSLPAKVFIFADDARPGYFGTWTRNSRIIGPRTPFARDMLVFDYAYDSGEEWEEETTGEVDDVVDDGDDEDVDAESADSDLDSWLVDDDDEPGTPLEERHASPLPGNFPVQVKRKAEDGARKLAKKRKVIVPLVPFSKGPCWETTIGRCEYDAFKPYRIQMFNDTPFPIDPFTFVSTCVEDKQMASKNASSDALFAIPSLPDRLVLPTSTSMPGPLNSSSSAVASSTTNRTAYTPKTMFPDAHLPFLLTKITSLQAASITFLVEAIYQELRTHKVKKNAIEAKVKEVGEKCKEKKFWVVKQSVMVGSHSSTLSRSTALTSLE